MPQTTPGWVNPALDADPSRWRFAPKRKGGWLAPGEPNPRTPQPMVLMPPGFDPQDRGNPFHIVVAPPGSPAPPDAITLTPETGEVYRPGSTALPPLNLTNLSLVSGPPPAPTSVPGGPAGPPGAGPPPSAPPMPGVTPPGAGPMGMPPAGMPGNAGPPTLPVSPGPGGGPLPMPPDGAALPPSSPPPSEGPLGQGQDVGSGADEGDEFLAMSPIARQARQLWTQLMVGSRLVGQPRPGQTALSLPPDVGAGEDVGVGQSPDEIYRMRQQALTEAANPWIGTPYSWGGNSTTPNPNAPALGDWDNRGVDCSGLVTSILRGFGMRLPGRPTTQTYYSMATPVQGPPQPGDILMNDAKTHMALYIGGGQMVEAPDRGGRVRIVPARQDLRPLRLREEVPGLDAATLLSRQAAGLNTTQDAAQGPPPAPAGPRGLMGLALQHGADTDMAAIMGAAAVIESGGRPDGPPGDRGQSFGLYQMHDRGAGINVSRENRQDPDYSTRYMLQKEFIPARARGEALGLAGENLATYIYMSAERPEGWRAGDPIGSLSAPKANTFREQWRQMVQLAERGEDLALGNARQVVPMQQGPTAGQTQVAQRGSAGPTGPTPLEPSLLQRAQEAVSQLGERIAQAIEPPTAYAAETAPTGRIEPAAAPAPAAIAPPATPVPPTSVSTAPDATTGPGPNPLAAFSNAIGGAASGLSDYVQRQVGAAGPQYPSPPSWGVSNPQAPPVAAARGPAGPSQAVNPGGTGGMAPVAPGGYPNIDAVPAGTYTPPPGTITSRAQEAGYQPGGAPRSTQPAGMTAEEALGDQRYQAALENLRRIGAPAAAIARIEAAPGDQKWALIQGAQDQYTALNSPQVVEKDGYAFVIGPDGQPHQLSRNAQGQQIHSQEITPGVTISQIPGSDPVMTRTDTDGSIWQSAPDGSNPRMVRGPQGLSAAQQAQADEAAARNRLTERGQTLEDQRGRLPYSQETVANARDRAQRESEFQRDLDRRREERATVSATDLLQAQNAMDIARARIQGDIDLRGTPSQDNLDSLRQAKEFHDSLSAMQEQEVAARDRAQTLEEQKFNRPYEERTAEQIASENLTRESLADRRAEAEQRHQEALLPYEQMTKAQQADADIAREKLGIEGQRLGIEGQRVGIEQQRVGLEGQRVGLESQRLQSDIEFRNRPDAVQLEHGALGLLDRRNGGFTLTRGAQPYEAGGNIITPPGSFTQLNYMPGAGRGDISTTPVFNGVPGIGYAGMPGYGGPGAYSQQQPPQRPQMGGWGGYGGGGGWGVGQGQDTSGRGWNDAAAPKAPGWVPPIDPRRVVGTGHRWGEHVSLEGTHHGVDLQAVRGTPVRSPEAGWVSNISYNPQGLGLQVEVRDPRGWRQQLSHLDQANVQMGQRVGAGQQVGQVGSTGASTGPHLDVRTVNPQGQRVNPTGWLGRLAHLPRADKAPVGRGQDEGMTRLYRGEAQTPNTTPDWVPRSPTAGQWYTDTPERAQWYVDDAGPTGRMRYVDVPSQAVEQYRVSNSPELTRFSRDPANEFVVPRHVAAQSQWLAALPMLMDVMPPHVRQAVNDAPYDALRWVMANRPEALRQAMDQLGEAVQQAPMAGAAQSAWQSAGDIARGVHGVVSGQAFAPWFQPHEEP